jgi:nucleotidyltransferase substrate binding protein (TIGR01987 family)
LESTKEYKLKLRKLIKAAESFKKLVDVDISKLNIVLKDGIKNGRIQKFEYCVELLWKTIKDYLYFNSSIDAKTPKQSVKEFMLAGFIYKKDYLILLEMLDARNQLSHMYNEKIFEEINKRMKKYLITITDVISVLQDKKKIV